jgi:hypothetical protein
MNTRHFRLGNYRNGGSHQPSLATGINTEKLEWRVPYFSYPRQTIWPSGIGLIAAITCLGIITPVVAAPTVITPGAANIANLAQQDQFTNGLNVIGGTPDTFNAASLQSLWKLEYTNTGAKAWTDFHIAIIGSPAAINAVGIQIIFNSSEVTSGFGAPPNIRFVNTAGIGKNTGKVAPPKVIAPVKVGDTVKMEILTENGAFATSYYLGVQPSSTAVIKPAAKNLPAKGADHSLSYIAPMGELQISNLVMNDTGFAGDTMLGAAIGVPTFSSVGELDDGSYLFESTGQFSVSSSSGTFLQGDLPLLSYFPSENLFYGEVLNYKLSGASPASPLYDPLLPDLGSDWVTNMRGLLDPTSPTYDPDQALYFTYSPLSNVYTLTQGFAVSGGSSGNSELFASPPVPEPSSIILLMTVLLCPARRPLLRIRV